MMAAARAAIDELDSSTLLIAVTVLTSMTAEELAMLGVVHSLDEQVLALAKAAQAQNLDGVVCSAQEASMLRAGCGDDFLLVTPGIRPHTVQADDQRRTCTPAEALRNGSNYLVIGRPVTQHDRPGAVLEKLLKQLPTR